MDVKETVRQQFDPVAAEYAVSAIHASGPALAATVGLSPCAAMSACSTLAQVRDTPLWRSRRVLPMSSRSTWRRRCWRRGSVSPRSALFTIANVTFQRGDIEALGEPYSAFDLVTSRYSAHHFPHPRHALAEIVRVLKPGGAFHLVDRIAPGDPAPDTMLNAIELLRDPSHVRGHTREQ